MKRQYTDDHAASGVNEKLPEIETWPNQYRTGYEIEITMPEFTSVCPKTGLPDHGTLILRYAVRTSCLGIEIAQNVHAGLGRNPGILQENVVNRMLADIVQMRRSLDSAELEGVLTRAAASSRKSR